MLLHPDDSFSVTVKLDQSAGLKDIWMRRFNIKGSGCEEYIFTPHYLDFFFIIHIHITHHGF
jgi:hypothetical protein